MRVYYVYELYGSNSSLPFYVGKTYVKSYRLHQHISDKRRSAKTHKIQELLNNNHSILEKILFETNNEADAYNEEQRLIKLYGRKDIGTGVLCNHTDGGEGLSGLSKPAKQKPVHCYSLSGSYIGSFESIAEASRELDINKVSISQNCRQIRGPAKSKKFNCYYQFSFTLNLKGIEKRNMMYPQYSIKAVSDLGDKILFDSYNQTAKYFKVSAPTIQNRVKKIIQSPLVFNNTEWTFSYNDDLE